MMGFVIFESTYSVHASLLGSLKICMTRLIPLFTITNSARELGCKDLFVPANSGSLLAKVTEKASFSYNFEGYTNSGVAAASQRIHTSRQHPPRRAP